VGGWVRALTSAVGVLVAEDLEEPAQLRHRVRRELELLQRRLAVVQVRRRVLRGGGCCVRWLGGGGAGGVTLLQLFCLGLLNLLMVERAEFESE
jgi:hypothetical protein